MPELTTTQCSKRTSAPISPLRILPLVTSREEGRGVIALRPPFPFVELTLKSQSKQSARLSFQSPELGPPSPSPARECFSSSLWVQGGKHNSLRGRAHFRRRDRHSGTLGIYYNPSTVKIYNIFRG
jgi:hypothetical protein